jgi:hypothetical protein
VQSKKGGVNDLRKLRSDFDLSLFLGGVPGSDHIRNMRLAFFLFAKWLMWTEGGINKRYPLGMSEKRGGYCFSYSGEV